jgi:magnesium and cobalt transporter
MEQIVGEISDEYDRGEEGYIKKHRGDRYTVKARTPIGEFNSYFGTQFEDEEFDTIGGLVLKALGHMPSRGESLRLGGYKFTVLRSDARRIHLLRVSRSTGNAASEGSSRQVSVG